MGGGVGEVSRAHSMPHMPLPEEETTGAKLTSARAQSTLATTNAALVGLVPRQESLSSNRTPARIQAAAPGTSGRPPEIGPATPSESATGSGRSHAATQGSTSLRRMTDAPVFTANSPFYDFAIEIDHAPPPPLASNWRAMAAAPLNGLASFGGNAMTYLKNGAASASKYVGEKLSAGKEKSKELATAGFAKGKQAATFGAGQVAKVATSAASGLQVMGLDGQFVGAAAGHLIHQTAAVGVPTFIREVMNEALFAALRQLPHTHVMGLQVVSGTVSLGLHRFRQYREQRNPEAAARGFHNLSAEQWAALPPEEQQAKMEQQRRYSDAVTTLATGAIMTNIALGATGPHIGQPELAAKLVASDAKVLAYAAMRDSIQASFRMVGIEGETNGGVSGANMDAAGNFYAKANVIANYGFSAFVPEALGEARLALAGEKSTLDKHEAMNVVLHSSVVKATLNTLLETADWTNVTQEEAKEAGTHQKFDPALKGKREDYMRVFDQSIARTAAINSNIAAGNLLSVIGEAAKLPATATTLLSNSGGGVMAGLSYKVIGGTWQAEGAVRAEMDGSTRPATEETALTG